jgi:hypothetical protein
MLVAVDIDSLSLVPSSFCLNHCFCFIFFDPQPDKLTEFWGSLRRLGLFYDINKLTVQTNINSFIGVVNKPYIIRLLIIIRIEICKFVIFCIKYIVCLCMYYVH